MDSKLNRTYHKYSKYLKRYLKNNEISTLTSVPFKNEIIPARVIDVYDGDTCTIVFLMGKKNYIKLKLRINGVDTPELRPRRDGRTDEELQLEKRVAAEIKGVVSNMILDRILPVKIEKWDKYGGRVNGHIYLDETCKTTLTDFLLDKGFAKPYDGGKKDEWIQKDLNYILKCIKLHLPKNNILYF